MFIAMEDPKLKLRQERNVLHVAPNGARNGGEHSIAINVTSQTGLPRHALRSCLKRVLATEFHRKNTEKLCGVLWKSVLICG